MPKDDNCLRICCPGYAVNSCMTVIVRWSATDEIKGIISGWHFVVVNPFFFYVGAKNYILGGN